MNWEAIQNLQKALAVAESAIPIKDTLDLNEFNRQVDSTILRVNAAEIVTKLEVKRVLLSWLADADCNSNDKAEIFGAKAERRFTIQFKGNAGYAQRNLNKGRALLRNPQGGWREFPQPPIAAGGATTKVYVDVDKNPYQLKREGDERRLRDSFKHFYESKRIHFNRADGLFSFNGVPLALLETNNDDLPSNVGYIKWKLAAVAPAEIDRDAVLANYRSRARIRTPVADVAKSG